MRDFIDAPGQEWDKKTLDDMRRDGIIFDPRGVHAVRIIERKSGKNVKMSPIIEIATEDDGHIDFRGDSKLVFDEYWLDYLIDILKTTKKELRERGL